ncbi:MAG TPA: serine/threonine-protein kinase [Vicinamibacterales bacterium]|nr:serine/threonine-protein kinase [Vicinamibacterales bacterium]
MAARTRPLSGELGWELGDYSILRTVDSGKFGIVYWALHKPTGRQAALKLIPLEGADSEEKVAAERHGAMLQQQFSRAHKHLVPEIFEHQPIAMFYAIAMELVHGQPLSDVISAGALAPARAAKIALAISRFLAAAHRFETDVEGVHYALIVHGDLKPDHVLLLDNDEIRVLDFGIAKALAERTLVTTNKWGSIQYASPERLQSEGHVNEHADFWSLGVMLFEMVAGYRPYHRYEHNASRLDAAIRRQEAPEPLPANADPVLVAIIRKLLAAQIERRYTSADAIVRDLEAYLAGAQTLAATDTEQASIATVRVTPGRPTFIPPIPIVAGPAPSQSVPTEALPRTPPTIATEAIAPPPAKTVKKRSRARTLLRFAVMFVLFSMVTRECVGLARADRLRERLDAIEAGQVPEIRSEYRRIASTGPLGLGAGQVRVPLRDRMVALADRAILEFRTGSTSVSEVEWTQARDYIAFAQELSSRSAIRAKRAYIDAHLARIAARDRAGFEEAVRSFRESARLDPQAPDPYLGLARTYAYSLREVEPLIDAIKEAEQRGYQPGPREQAQIGDAYRFRADRTRAAAVSLGGDERAQQLASAARDYGQCIAHFEGLDFFDSENNLRTCRRRLAAIVEELNRPEADES